MIVSLDTASRISKDCKKHNQKVLFIHGCFDILHMGHIQLFQYAKKYADNVIVAVNSDKSIKLNKGTNRPVNKLEYRLGQLDELQSISTVTYINNTLDFNTVKAETFFRNLESSILPDYILTCPTNDIYYEQKKKRLDDLGIELLSFKKKVNTSTSNIVEKLMLAS